MGNISHPSHSKEGPTELYRSKGPQLLFCIAEKQNKNKNPKTAAELGMEVHTWSPSI